MREVTLDRKVPAAHFSLMHLISFLIFFVVLDSIQFRIAIKFHSTMYCLFSAYIIVLTAILHEYNRADTSCIISYLILKIYMPPTSSQDLPLSVCL